MSLCDQVRENFFGPRGVSGALAVDAVENVGHRTGEYTANRHSTLSALIRTAVDERDDLAAAGGASRAQRLWLGLRQGQGHRVDRRRIVTQLDVERLSLRRRDGECILDESHRNRHRVREIFVRADGIDQEQFVAAQSALLLRRLRRRNAVKRGQHWYANQIHERLPVAVGTVSCHRAELQRAESGRPEQLHRIENGENRFRVLEGEIAILETEQHAERLVRGGDFHFLRGRKSLRNHGFEEETEASTLRQLLLAAQANGGGCGLVQLNALG